MIGWIVLIACVVLMYRVAEMENLSGLIWGAVTFVLCFLCSMIPIPFINILIGLAISFVAMTVYNMKYGKPR